MDEYIAILYRSGCRVCPFKQKPGGSEWMQWRPLDISVKTMIYTLRPFVEEISIIDTPKRMNWMSTYVKLERRWVLLQFKKDLFAVNKPINSPIHFEVEERTCDAFPEKYHKTLWSNLRYQSVYLYSENCIR